MRQAPSSLRVFQLAGITSPAGNSLRSLSARKLPDGALAMVGTALYYLDKNSVASPNDSDVVAALGGGNWLAFIAAEGITPPSVIGQVYAASSDGEGGVIAGWRSPEPIVTHASDVTSLTLTAEHINKRHRFTAATPVTVTIPASVTFADPGYTFVNFTQAGAGQVEIVGAVGVTINKPASTTRKTSEQFAMVSLSFVAVDEWDLIGLLEAAA
jgi:hypothetical protein